MKRHYFTLLTLCVIAAMFTVLCSNVPRLVFDDPTTPGAPPASTSPVGETSLPSTESPLATNPPNQPTSAPTPAPDAAPTLVADGTGLACVGTFGYGLTCLDPAGWHTFNEQNSSLPNDQILDMHTCPDGKIWLATSSGLATFDGRQWQSISSSWGYTSPEALACDGKGGVWVGYYQGASHFDGSIWIDYPANTFGTGKFVDQVKDVAVGPDGKAWVSTANSVAVFDGKEWTVYEEGQGFNQEYFFEGLIVDHDNNVWVIQTNGLLRFDGQTWTPFEARHLSQPKRLAVDSQGQLWVGTYSKGLSVYNGGGWTIYDRSNSSLSSDSIKSLAVDGQGRIWVGTQWGLNIFDGTNWQTYCMGNADLADDEIYELAVVGEGPALPQHQEKATGVLKGRIVNGDDPVSNSQVEVGVEFVGFLFSGATPLADQPFHQLVSTDSDGYFEFSDLPVGRYVVVFQGPDGKWLRLTDSFGLGNNKAEIKPGETTDLHELDVSKSS